MIEQEPKPGMSRTIKVRPNPPIIPPPKPKSENADDRPDWLPQGATLVKAAGEPCDISLSSEYADAPAERQTAFADALRDLRDREARTMGEDSSIRL